MRIYGALFVFMERCKDTPRVTAMLYARSNQVLYRVLLRFGGALHESRAIDATEALAHQCHDAHLIERQVLCNDRVHIARRRLQRLTYATTLCANRSVVATTIAFLWHGGRGCYGETQ